MTRRMPGWGRPWRAVRWRLPGGGGRGGRDASVPAGPAGGEGARPDREEAGTSRGRRPADAQGAPGASLWRGTPKPPGTPEPPGRLSLPRRTVAALHRTAGSFKKHELSDRAAALTYFGVLSLLPALLVLVSLLSLAGASVTAHVVDDLKLLVPGSAQHTVTDAVHRLQASTDTGSALAVVGLLGAVWTASGYVAGFIRAANAVHGMPEGRPLWRKLLVRLSVTVALMTLAAASALIVVFTGGIAERAGATLGIGHSALTAWTYAKWPVLVVLVAVMITLLYRATPNVRMRGTHWITAGSCLALLAWMAASTGFALYVANFASYNKTYGTLAGVIVFLVWLWISNLAILFGLAFDAELARERAAVTGAAPATPRDTRTWSEEDRRDAERDRYG